MNPSRMLAVAVFMAALGATGCGGGGGKSGLAPLPSAASASAALDAKSEANVAFAQTAPPQLQTASQQPEDQGFPESFILAAGESRSDRRGRLLSCGRDVDTGCHVTGEGDTISTTGGTLTAAVDPMLLAANIGSNARRLLNRIAITNTRDPYGLQRGTPTSSNSKTGGLQVIEQSTMPLTRGGRVTRTHTQWDNEDSVPSMGLTISRLPLGDFDEVAAVSLLTPASAPEGMELIPLPSLGSGWSGVALQETAADGKTIYANVYSNIRREIQLNAEGQALGPLDISGMYVGETGPLRGTFRTYMVDPNNPHIRVSLDININPKFDGGDGWFGKPGFSREEFGTEWAMGDAIEVGVTPGRRSYFYKNLQCVEEDGCQLVDGRIQGQWRLENLENGFYSWAEKDVEYLTLGTWLSVPSSDDGQFDVGAFAGGPRPFYLIELDQTGGKASYEGPATGIFVAGSYASGSSESPETPARLEDVLDAHVGTFIATASLEADFRAWNTPIASGSVHSFKDSVTGDVLGDVGNGWVVQLNQASGFIGGHNRLDGSTSGNLDGNGAEGRWGVRFFPDGNPDDGLAGGNEAGRYPELNPGDLPGLAAGTFSATSLAEQSAGESQDYLQITGAFSASKYWESQE